MAVYNKNIQSTDALGFVVYSKSLESFEADIAKDNSPIKHNNIYFIGQERKLYLDGVYYGLSTEELQTLSNNIQALANIIEKPIQVKYEGLTPEHAEGPQGTQTEIYKYTTIGPALKYLDQQLNSLKGGGSGSVADQISQAINALGATFKDNYIDAELYTAEDEAQNAEHVAGTVKTPAGVQGGAHVGIKVVQTDGQITTVDLVEDDIASAAGLQGVQSQLTSGIQGVQSQITSGIQGVQSQLDLLTSGDLSTIQNAITAIKNEIGGEEGDEGPQGAQTRNLIGSLLDAVATLLPAKNQETNNYTLYIGGEEGVQVTKLQDAIDTLNTLIGEANSGSSEGIQGVQTRIDELDATIRDNYNEAQYYEEGDTLPEGKNVGDLKEDIGVQGGHVGVKIEQENGKLKGVDIIESDIASAATVNTLVGQLTWQVM